MRPTRYAVIQACMRDVDRTLLRKNLKLTPTERLEKFVKFIRFTSEWAAGR